MNFRENYCGNFDSKMPLSEFYRSVNGRNESHHQKSPDISYIPNDEFVELVWEKGQIMMQGQSSKARKTPVSNNFLFQTPKVQEKEGLVDVPMPEMGLNPDDDMVPWLNYPLDDYCSDLLPEISGVTGNDHNGLNVLDKRISYNHKDSHPHGIGLDQSNAYKVSRSSHVLDPSGRSGVLDIGSSNCRSKPHNLEKMVQKQDSSQLPYSSSSSTLLNFSHFSRPAAMARANLQNRGPQKENGSTGQPGLDSVKVGSNPFVSKPVEVVEKSSNVVVDANLVKGRVETEKSNEPVGASSSVCSGNSAERASNDLTKNCKRKSHDTEDSECQSQDVEEESLGTKTAATSRGGSGSKRSRAAEVHNLSERRRRDRINEKMRALQELIPNCNKVDKASMLDEAIEYLKTLQLQVQIMSMGTGLCMPPMMFPTGMQHMHPHFSPMGIGMGMSYGMGMGMGMEMNGGSQGHPHMFQFSPTTQGSRHHVPSPIPGLDAGQGIPIPRSSFPVYGHPGQGMPMVFPQSPMPAFPNPTVRQMGGTQGEARDPAPSSNDPMQNKNPNPITQISNQAQLANKNLNQSTLVDRKDQVVETGCSTAGIN